MPDTLDQLEAIANAVAYLRKNAPELAKLLEADVDKIDGGDVHVPSAIGEPQPPLQDEDESVLESNADETTIKVWSDEAREAAAEARAKAAAHHQAYGHATRANLGATGNRTTHTADAMGQHQRAIEHYEDAARHFDAG